jgi:hypothetical protein
VVAKADSACRYVFTMHQAREPLHQGRKVLIRGVDNYFENASEIMT